MKTKTITDQLVRRISSLGLMLCLPIFIFAQDADDPTLFWVGDEPVPTSEFMYIYNKNNAGSADYSESSVREYLDLYKKFKLKVHHARTLQMDTIERLNNELSGYREQLASTYLNDNSVMSRLASEAYDRMKREVEVSHILIKLPKNAVNKDTANAYSIANEIYKSIAAGQVSFEDAVTQMSQDDKTVEKGGYIGFTRAILPKGYYQLESAIYKLDINEVSPPARSPRGYHIVKVLSSREAQAEVDIAHIFIKKNKKSKDNNAEAQRKIADIHARLTQGVAFEEIVSKESQDSGTARKGGRIGYIKTGEYEKDFEQAALSLSADGEISEPIETRVGFHILKRLGVKESLSFKDSKRRIENELRNTERAALAKQTMIDRIKAEEGLSINENAKNKLAGQMDETSFFTYRWKKPVDESNTKLISFASNDYHKTTSDFVDYIEKNPKERVRLKSKGKNQALDILFNEFINESALELEKQQLEKKHPEFASLMREYEEGILLFEITKNNVWDRATADTIGLKNYFDANRQKYQHPSEIDVVTYTIANTTEKKAKKIVKEIKKKTPEEMMAAYPNIPQDIKTITQTSAEASSYEWKIGKTGGLRPLGSGGTAFTVTETKTIRPSRLKELNETRGYVIADYQEQLEENWLKELKSKYTLKENDKAVMKLIKK